MDGENEDEAKGEEDDGSSEVVGGEAHDGEAARGSEGGEEERHGRGRVVGVGGRRRGGTIL